MKALQHRRLKQLAGWTMAWVVTMAVASFGPKFIWDYEFAWNVVAVLLNLATGLAMIMANRNLFNDLDELQKKVQLEALGITLGLAVVVGLTYSLLDATNLIPYDAEISGLVMFIGITYFTATVLNSRRYR